MLVDASLHGRLEVRDVEDVRHGELVGRGAGEVFLIQLVVQHDVGLPVQVQHGPLMCVPRPDVRRLGDDSA